MCAYNKLNGTYCSEHHELLMDILKEEWGFEGLVVSDWGAVHDRVKALQGRARSGNARPPRPPGTGGDRRRAQRRAGRGACWTKRCGASCRSSSKPRRRPRAGEVPMAAHHALARRIAGEGIVLLKNDGVLPLRNPQRIAVIGRSAQEPHFQGGGSSHINPAQVDIPFTELEKLAHGARADLQRGLPCHARVQAGSHRRRSAGRKGSGGGDPLHCLARLHRVRRL